jgi:hypothetical protein
MLDTHEPAPGQYRHFKGGMYTVVGIATHSETGEQLVVYRALHGEGTLWVRPLSMFVENVTHEGKSKPRFMRLTNANAGGDGTTP